MAQHLSLLARTHYFIICGRKTQSFIILFVWVKTADPWHQLHLPLKWLPLTNARSVLKHSCSKNVKLTHIIHLNLADLSKFGALTVYIFSQFVDQGWVILHTQLPSYSDTIIWTRNIPAKFANFLQNNFSLPIFNYLSHNIWVCAVLHFFSAFRCFCGSRFWQLCKRTKKLLLFF